MVHNYRVCTSKRHKNIFYEQMMDLTINNRLPPELDYMGSANPRLDSGKEVIRMSKELFFYHKLGFFEGNTNFIRVYDLTRVEGKAPVEITAIQDDKYLSKSILLLLENIVGKMLEEVEVKTIFIPIKKKREHDIKIR